MTKKLMTEEDSALIYARVEAAFEKWGHYPSEPQKKSLESLINTFCGVAAGDTEFDKAYLSDLPPGVGKTTTLIQFVNYVTEHEHLNDIGILICINTMDEIHALAQELDQSKLCVWVSENHDTTDKKKLARQCRDLGLCPAEEAQVLVTTHSRMEAEFSEFGRISQTEETRCFSKVARFKYHGNDRQLRVWDEAYLPGIPVVLPVSDIRLRLVPYLSEYHFDAGEKLRNAELLSKHRAPGHTWEFPDFWSEFDLTKEGFKAALRKCRITGAQQEQTLGVLDTLLYLQGRKVAVQFDGNFVGDTVLTYKPSDPPPPKWSDSKYGL